MVRALARLIALRASGRRSQAPGPPVCSATSLSPPASSPAATRSAARPKAPAWAAAPGLPPRLSSSSPPGSARISARSSPGC
ncbi:MAG: hypothetical protein ACK56I_34155, partial [bacterium]